MSKQIEKLGWPHIVALTLLGISGVTLIGLQLRPDGWIALAIGLIITLTATQGLFRRHVALVYFSVSLLGLIPITTEITNENFLRMGAVLLAALVTPYYLSRKFFKDKTIKYTWHHGRRWLKKEVFYVLITVAIAYFLLPYYLKSTGAYLNWYVEDTPQSIGRLFIGTNALGIWD